MAESDKNHNLKCKCLGNHHFNPLPFRMCAPNAAPAECPTLAKHATNTMSEMQMLKKLSL